MICGEKQKTMFLKWIAAFSFRGCFENAETANWQIFSADASLISLETS